MSEEKPHPVIDHLQPIPASVLWDIHISPHTGGKTRAPKLHEKFIFCGYSYGKCYKPLTYVGVVNSTDPFSGVNYVFECRNCISVKKQVAHAMANNMNVPTSPHARINVRHSDLLDHNGMYKKYHSIPGIYYFKPPEGEQIWKLEEVQEGRNSYTTSVLLMGDGIDRFWLKGFVPDLLLK